jgi:hypothetical protein
MTGNLPSGFVPNGQGSGNRDSMPRKVAVMRWQRRSFTATGLTQVPPGPHIDKLARHSIGTIKVTEPNYDNIGEVLSAMGVSFEPFDHNYDCDLLFMNCGSGDELNPTAVRHFVEGGGCLYASDLTSGFLSLTFPGSFNFQGQGRPGMVNAQIIDPELQAIVGRTTTIHFDMGAWSILQSCSGDTLVEAAPGSNYAGLPLMVGVEVGRGAVFYTSFHNSAQASDQEKVLLQLLVLKQIGAKSNTTMEQASRSVGVSLTALKAQSGG